MGFQIRCGWLLLVMMVFALGCGGPHRTLWESLNPESWSYQDVKDDPFEFEVLGPVAVDVQSFNGSVFIEANPKLEAARVIVTREATHGPGRKDEAKDSLAEITYTVDFLPSGDGHVIQVLAGTTHIEPHFQRAHIRIEAPDIRGVTAHTSNGRVFAKGVSGSIDVSTTNDDVRIMTNRAILEPVTIINREGDIDYRIRGESTGNFDCRTIEGRVVNNIEFGELIIEPETRDDILRARLNAGTNQIIMRTVNGDIRIAVVNNPEQVGDFIIR